VIHAAWYELVDAGDGRRLERFGNRLLDRPAPVVDDAPQRAPGQWASADARFERVGSIGRWIRARSSTDVQWGVADNALGIRLELRLADGGQVGAFPEHFDIARWAAAEAAEAATATGSASSFSVLNLFAYTGVMTLALAAAGAAVTHVDASRTAVAWARRNAVLSGLESGSIRWIVDDAERFVAREVRRARRYDAIVLDPPSFGRASGRRTWQLENRLGPLLRELAHLRGGRPGFVLVSAHTIGFDGRRLVDLLADAFPHHSDIEAGQLDLEASSGAHLPLGAYARARL
jgi:23S rRNA (cytosine1962-C5)-methyltransferase